MKGWGGRVKTDDRFGTHLSSHKGTIGAGGWLWYVGAILLASTVANLAQSQLALAAAAALGAAVALAVAVSRLRQNVEVYERGLVWKQFFGTTTIAAEDIRGATLVHNHRRTGYYVEVRIALKRGGKRSIIGVANAEQLRNYVSAWAHAPSTAPLPNAGARGALAGWVPPAERRR
jgi:hypothetical protein